MSLMVAKCNSFPCTSAKNGDRTGVFGAREKFFGSFKGFEKRPPTDCKTVYPGSIPGVASTLSDAF
jgi:hypothetical protein